MTVDSRPSVPSADSSVDSSGVKAARPDIVTIEQSVDVDLLDTIVFEKLGAQELISITRHDLINGEQIDYRPLRQLSRLSTPSSWFSLQGTSNQTFANFTIKLEEKIPYSIDSPVAIVNNEVVVSVVNLERDEQVEVQIISYGDILDDTIYEEEL
jgi:preprotein translocase subunit SecD